ncbi:hypothetical protein M5689_014940 [Euphorbia peplus]|nr:hypothetical protein M5689_014940 [Euphorbia peplus]
MLSKVIEFDQGYENIQFLITKLTSSLDGSPDQFSPEDFMIIYTTV